MTLDITFPFLKDQNVRNLIITELTYEYPLTAKRIYNRLKKKYGIGTGYHRIYMAIQELVEKNILEKKNRDYKLSMDWIKNNYEFAKRMKKQYENAKRPVFLSLSDKNPTVEIRFENILELDRYSLELHNYFYPKLEKNEKVIMIYQHHWWQLVYPTKQYNDIETNKKFYFVCAGNTNIDKQSCNSKKRQGFNVINYDMARVADTTIYGDIVISIFYEPEIRHKMDDMFESISKIEELDVSKMIDELFKKKTEIIMIINKNKKLAEQIKNKVFEMF